MPRMTDEELAKLRESIINARSAVWWNDGEPATNTEPLFAAVDAAWSAYDQAIIAKHDDDHRWRYVADGELPESHYEVRWTRKDESLTTGWMLKDYKLVYDQIIGRCCDLESMRAWRPLPKPAPPVREGAKP